MTYESLLVQRLREKGFAVEANAGPGEYIVTASGETPLPLRPRLLLPDALLAEYVTALVQEHGSAEEALEIMEIHIEETLDSVEGDGLNHALEVGVRREPNGRAGWFARAESVDLSAPPADPDLRWQGTPPDGG